MHTFKFNYIKIITLIFTSQLFFGSVVGADFEEEANQVLLIGRPEQGGVDLKQIPLRFSQLAKASFWYLDPRSSGSSSITGAFPYLIPESKPQQFDVVCLEQGMLNEVVIHYSSPSSSSTPQIAPSHDPSFSEEDMAVLQKLKAERFLIWEMWRKLQDVDMKELRARIIGKALEAGLIQESIEFGRKYYRITGAQNTARAALILEQLLVENRVPEEEAFRNLKQRIDDEFKNMTRLDNLIDPLQKRLESPVSTGEPSQPTVMMAPYERNDPREVLQQISSFLHSAWNLVAPGGTMIVFSGNARIDGTELAEGISKDYLGCMLPDCVEIEEVAFPGQNYEGESYISNPVFPAKIDTYGWTGGRAPGSYLLIRKTR